MIEAKGKIEPPAVVGLGAQDGTVSMFLNATEKFPDALKGVGFHEDGLDAPNLCRIKLCRGGR
jgi:hypothetical protein